MISSQKIDISQSKLMAKSFGIN